MKSNWLLKNVCVYILWKYGGLGHKLTGGLTYSKGFYLKYLTIKFYTKFVYSYLLRTRYEKLFNSRLMVRAIWANHTFSQIIGSNSELYFLISPNLEGSRSWPSTPEIDLSHFMPLDNFQIEKLKIKMFLHGLGE